MVLGNPKLTRRGTSGVHIEGVDKTLKALRKLDVEVFNALVSQIRGPMETAASRARSRFPANREAASGWQSRKAKNPVPPKAFPYYNQALAQKGVRAVVNKKTGKSRRSYKLAALVQKNAGAVVYDMAKQSENNFAATLTAFGGQPSRVMWPTMRSMQSSIVSAITSAVRKAERIVDKSMPNKKFYE